MYSTPRHLYRFREITEFLDPILLECQLFFSLYQNLNDPNEGFYRVDFTKDVDFIRRHVVAVKQQIRSQGGKLKISERVLDANKNTPNFGARIRQWQELDEQELINIALQQDWSQEAKNQFIESQKTLDDRFINVCCFCADYKNPAMSWYYAKENTGVCLEFDRNCKLFKRAAPVTYSKKLPTLKFYSDPISIHIVRTLYKSEYWKHENEWRIVNHQDVNSEYDYFEPVSLVSIGLLPKISDANKEKVFDLIRMHNKKYRRELKVYDFTLNPEEYGWTREECYDFVD